MNRSAGRHLNPVGSENTCLVTPHGGESLTGNHPGLMVVEER